MTDSSHYYDEKLAAERLQQVYTCAPPRVQQYLKAEIEYVASKLKPGDHILELGCGYGRVLKQLSGTAALAIGLDKSLPSLKMAQEYAGSASTLIQSNAVSMGLKDDSFDLTCCIQNGISAFHVDPVALLCEAVRITKPGGLVMFSSYADKFWPARIEWFKIQAGLGLLGEIDWERSTEGVIVCKDGFRATTFGPDKFRDVVRKSGRECVINEIDGSSIFCEIRV